MLRKARLYNRTTAPLISYIIVQIWRCQPKYVQTSSGPEVKSAATASSSKSHMQRRGAHPPGPGRRLTVTPTTKEPKPSAAGALPDDAVTHSGWDLYICDGLHIIEGDLVYMGNLNVKTSYLSLKSLKIEELWGEILI